MKKFIKQQWADNRQIILLAGAAFLFIAGAIQYAFGLTYILPLTPIFIAVLCGVSLLVWDAKPRNKAYIALGVVVAGYAVELIGVHTHLLFGNYAYGTVMGYRVLGVPITIGLTWFLVTLSAWHIMAFGRLATIYKFLLGGALVVMFDLILEQFASAYGLWVWRFGSIPLFNYISWFIVSQLFFFVYFKFTKNTEPSIFIASQLPLMALFFWLMLLVH
jgi:putative membrane protein